MNTFLKVISTIVVICIVFAIFITRDGKMFTPNGEGVVTLDIGDFEAFPLPDYALNMVNSDYKSYFVEVEPGIKGQVLDIGQGLPEFFSFLLMQRCTSSDNPCIGCCHDKRS